MLERTFSVLRYGLLIVTWSSHRKKDLAKVLHHCQISHNLLSHWVSEVSQKVLFRTISFYGKYTRDGRWKREQITDVRVACVWDLSVSSEWACRTRAGKSTLCCNERFECMVLRRWLLIPSKMMEITHSGVNEIPHRTYVRFKVVTLSLEVALSSCRHVVKFNSAATRMSSEV